MIFIVVTAVTLVLGMLIGAWLGGNFAQDFQFNGVRGYEATGQIGLLCSFFALFLLGAFYWIKKNK